MRKLLAHAGIIMVLLSIGILEPGPLFADNGEYREIEELGTTGVSQAIQSSATDVTGVLGDGLLVAQVTRPIRSDLQVAPHSHMVLSVALTELAVQPGTTVDEATGQTHVWGQLIVHRAFSIDLKAQTQHVPLLAVAYQGIDRVRGDEPEPLNFAEARTIDIVERLSIAWTLLDTGGTLEAAADQSTPPDNASIWHLTDPLGPQYGRPEPQFPTIYLRHPCLGSNSLKILTVYPEDALAFGQPDDSHGVPTPLTARELADYLVALLKAHHLLFHKQSTDLNSYDQLEICKTKDGRVFKDIAAQIRPAGAPGEPRDLKGVLEQLSMDQRVRLATLAYKAPIDWRLRSQP